MKNIEQYRKRFNLLLESTMGDVRPLINEEVDSKQAPHLRLYNCLKKDGWKLVKGSLDSGDEVEYSKFIPTGKSFKCKEGDIAKLISKVMQEGKQKSLFCERTKGVIRCNFYSHDIKQENFCANIIDQKPLLNKIERKFTFDGNGVNLTCDELMMKI